VSTPNKIQTYLQIDADPQKVHRKEAVEIKTLNITRVSAMLIQNKTQKFEKNRSG
jgi:hypothetical protein